MKVHLLLSIVVLAWFPSCSSETKPADVVFKNGNVYTVSDRASPAQAIAVKDSRIIFVGPDDEAGEHVGSDTQVIDLRGYTVVPGMTDSHCHLAGIGKREMTLNLEGTTSLEGFLEMVRARVVLSEPGQWITGRGWIETFWTPPVFPTCRDLDKVSPENPVFLRRADGHGAVANSLALQIAGIDRNTPDPFGGMILKVDRTGEPNGMLLDNAQKIVSRHIPAGGPGDHEREILLGVKRSVELGWCQVQDAGGTYSDVDLYKRLYREGKIKLRIYKAVSGPSNDSERLLNEEITVGAFDNRFTLRSIKVLLDGALGSRGAALLEPYSDYDSSGLLLQTEDDLMRLFVEALRKGIQIETHAIGDRANRLILDLYENAFKKVPPDLRKVRDPRWRVEHAQVVSPRDIPRFFEFGIIPSMQPSHAISDLHFAPGRIGIDRLAGAYAWRSFIESGSIIPAGSDAPVERGEPMIEFYAAVTRRDQNGFSGEGWHPEQAVSREQALKMLTLWPAYAAFEEDLRGSIETGKLADLTVLSGDIMKISEQEILDTRCVMTVIGGEVVFVGEDL
jgi:predicted amidohydrolase YtcJ